MSEGSIKGIALPLHRPPSRNSFPGGELQGARRQGGAGIPGPQLELHFNERPFLKPVFIPVHHPYNEGTHAAAERLLVFAGVILPRESRRTASLRFLEAVRSSGVCHLDSGLVRWNGSRRRRDHRKGKGGRPGEKYFSLSQEDTPPGGHHWGRRKCASATNSSRCIRFPTRKATCPSAVRTGVIEISPRTAATAPFLLPPRRADAALITILQSVLFIE